MARIVTPSEMRGLEAGAFAAGQTAEGLMEDVGRRMAEAIVQHAGPGGGLCVAYVGRGHNGGDALVAARHLACAGWSIEVRLAHDDRDMAPLTARQLARLGIVPVTDVGSDPGGALDRVLDEVRLVGRRGRIILLDGLLGIGARLPLRPPIALLCEEMNRLRRARGAVIFALDIPTGVDGESGRVDPSAVRADHTLTVAQVKSGLVADAATDHVGRLSVIPVAALAGAGQGEIVLTGADLGGFMPPRRHDTHKGDYGRVSVLAGSVGYAGASVLCATGALRAGAGLVTLHVPREIYVPIVALAPPELMVRPVDELAEAMDLAADAGVLGPGLGSRAVVQARALARSWRVPLVIDADGLNALSEDDAALLAPVAPRLLTPHPGEMRRLMEWGEETRAEIAARFVANRPVTLLLKGGRSIIAASDHPLAYNTTGGPAMAVGGMGDVLAGVCGGLLAQGLGPWEAGAVGAWVCGRAAECALAGGASQESLLASDVLGALGLAFSDLRAWCY